MRYSVVRKLKNGFQVIAETRYLEDAKAVLANWHSGYITNNGEIVFRKGSL